MTPNQRQIQILQANRDIFLRRAKNKNYGTEEDRKQAMKDAIDCTVQISRLK